MWGMVCFLQGMFGGVFIFGFVAISGELFGCWGVNGE
jgi:hypothetical protein